MFGAFLTDLSKAFNCLDDELLIAKLNAYSFSLLASKLVQDYLSSSKQRNKVNKTYSEVTATGINDKNIQLKLIVLDWK